VRVRLPNKRSLTKIFAYFQKIHSSGISKFSFFISFNQSQQIITGINIMPLTYQLRGMIF